MLEVTLLRIPRPVTRKPIRPLTATHFIRRRGRRAETIHPSAGLSAFHGDCARVRERQQLTSTSGRLRGWLWSIDGRNCARVAALATPRHSCGSAGIRAHDLRAKPILCGWQCDSNAPNRRRLARGGALGRRSMPYCPSQRALRHGRRLAGLRGSAQGHGCSRGCQLSAQRARCGHLRDTRLPHP